MVPLTWFSEVRKAAPKAYSKGLGAPHIVTISEFEHVIMPIMFGRCLADSSLDAVSRFSTAANLFRNCIRASSCNPNSVGYIVIGWILQLNLQNARDGMVKFCLLPTDFLFFRGESVRIAGCEIVRLRYLVIGSTNLSSYRFVRVTHWATGFSRLGTFALPLVL